jgi:hypothetical protein
MTSSTTIPVFFGKTFTISGLLASFSSFASVFDQYRIREVECWIIPTMLSNPQTNGNIDLISAVDYDDANPPVTLGALYGYTNVIQTNILNGHYWKFRPHIAVAVYSGTFTSFKNEEANWIDVASGSVQHYGIKGAMSPATQPVVVNLNIRIHVQFRNTF